VVYLHCFAGDVDSRNRCLDLVHGPPWRWCWGRGGRGRRPKPRLIGHGIRGLVFAPLNDEGLPLTSDPILIMPDELEALRLVYFMGMTQEEAAKAMGVSRGTLWRALSSGRRKVIQALIERRPLVITEVKL